MKIWMSGEVDSDVGDAEHVARNYIEKKINDSLAGIKFSEKFDKWAFISIILSEEFIEIFPEVKKKSRDGKLIEFRLRIRHDIFITSNETQQISMIFDAIERSIDLMPELNVSLASQKKFRKAVLSAREAGLI